MRLTRKHRLVGSIPRLQKQEEADSRRYYETVLSINPTANLSFWICNQAEKSLHPS